MLHPDHETNPDQPPFEGRAHTTMAAGITLTQGRYIIQEYAGYASSAEIYTGYDAVARQSVLIRGYELQKFAPVEYIEAAAFDAHKAAGSPHPNILRIYNYEKRNNALFIVSERLYQPLRGVLTTYTPDMNMKIRLARQVASALAYLHGKGVTYGILTPNMLDITPSGDARLMDVGGRWLFEFMAKPFPPDIFMSINYLAPEERSGSAPSFKTDIYHYGALLWQLFTGEEPHQRITATALQQNLQVPDAITRIIGNCVADDPSRRPQDMGIVYYMLRGSPGEQTQKMPRTICTISAAKKKFRREQFAPTQFLDENPFAPKKSKPADESHKPTKNEPLFPSHSTETELYSPTLPREQGMRPFTASKPQTADNDVFAEMRAALAEEQQFKQNPENDDALNKKRPSSGLKIAITKLLQRKKS